jgi:uncharacterized membrane protein
VLRVDTQGMSSPAQRLRENVTGIVSVLVTGTWLAALMLGFEWWLPFMLFGYIALVPITAMLFDEDEEEAEQSADPQNRNKADRSHQDAGTENALQTLRDRYARGELTDQQFEQKLERLLETETIEDAEERARRVHTETDSGRDADREFDLETETE